MSATADVAMTTTITTVAAVMIAVATTMAAVVAIKIVDAAANKVN